MDKRKIFLGLGVLLLMITLLFTINNSRILFSELYRNGGTFIQLEVTNDVDVDKLKDIISINAGLKKDDIDIEKNNGKLEIKFDLVKLDVRDSITSKLSNEFGNTIQVRSAETYGKATKTTGSYIIYFMILIAFLLSVFMIVSNTISISKSSKQTS